MVDSKAAPEGRHIAVLFQRDCGATTPFTTQVSVIRSGEQASGGANAFVADADHGAATRGPWGGPWAETVWLSPNHLLIRHDAKARIFTHIENVSGVQVSLEPVRR